MARKDLEETKDESARYPVAPPASDGAVDQLSPGTRVGSYVVLSKIASGGGGTVYLAESVTSPGRVAIKVLLRELATSAQALARFQREAEVVKLIDHPNIAAVLESGALPDGRPYIVMELVAGDTLRTLLRRRGRLSPVEMMQILEPTCSALAAAHAAGVVHRDLKGSNISVGEGEDGPVVNLLDFGIAKLTQADPSTPGLTVKGSRLGTPYAMAPEQIRGDEVDERADIYSLGVLAFQMLTGSYPFSAPSAHELERLHLEAVPPRPSRMAPVAPAIEAVIIRCLEKRPEARFRTVAEFLDALRTAVAGQPTAVAADERPAVAISVEVTVPDDDGQAGSADDAAEDLETVWDIAEQTLREAGFELPLVTGNLIVAARLLPADPAERRRQVEAALQAAREVRRRVDRRSGAYPSLTATIGLHVGAAQVQGGSPSERIAGGAILQVASWGLAVDLDGVRATRDAATDLA